MKVTSLSNIKAAKNTLSAHKKKGEAPRPDASLYLNYLCNENPTSGCVRRRGRRHGLRRHRSYRAWPLVWPR